MRHIDEMLLADVKNTTAKRGLTRSVFWLSIAFFALTACIRVAFTYPVLSQFYDEPYHIASGMEWLEKHVYLYERQHPPLSRIAVALPLYLRGLRGHAVPGPRPPDPDGRLPIEDGNAILNSHGEYMSNLAWARAGNLPFFLLSIVLLGLLGDLLFGSLTAIVAVALFTLLPPVLGQAGVATTDISPVAGLLAVVYALVLWVEQPTVRKSVLFGLALGFASITKFSLLPFLALGFSMTFLWTWVRHPEILPWRRIAPGRLIRNLAIIFVVASVAIWSVYRFHFAAVITGHGYTPSTRGLGLLRPVADWLLAARIPLGEFFGGIGAVMIHNQWGHPSFLLGSVRNTGWWYYFPVVLAVKVPVSFLCLLLFGIPIAMHSMWYGNWRQGLPILFAAAILTSCMLARINIGVRHILPIFSFFALIAAQAVVSCFPRDSGSIRLPFRVNSFFKTRSLIIGIFSLGLLVESAGAHPDYAASFNILGGKHPERILVNGDLDAGQDLKRLSDRLRILKVTRLKLGYFGSADLTRMGLPPFEELNPREPVSGWIALSAFKLELECAENGNYCWLRQQQPLERIGRSIFLYHLAEPVPGGPKSHG
jgi:hypothetical protein